MRSLILLLLLLLGLTLRAQVELTDPQTPAGVLPSFPASSGQWVLEFSDEFNDTVVDPAKWNILDSPNSRAARPGLGIDDWFWKPQNLWEADGNLVMEVTKHDFNTMYCGSVHSKNKYEPQYGFFECRIRIAEAAKGTHTAFWFQGQGMSQVDGTGNDGAEIDVFESAWLEDFTKAVVHIDGYGSHKKANTKRYDTPGLHDTVFHTFGLHWTPDFLKIYYDGQLVTTYQDAKWIPRAPEYLWLSDGASFGIQGNYFTSQPNGTLTYAYVDYVRAWRDPSLGTPTGCNLINLSEGKPAQAKSSVNNQLSASNLTDGNAYENDSRWVSAQGDFPNWVEIDLEQRMRLERIRFLSGFNGFNQPIRDFNLTYWDGSAWQEIFAETNNTESLFSRYFTSVVTDKVRMNILQASDSYARLYELQLFGRPHLSGYENVALGKPAVAKSTLSPAYPASLLTDGLLCEEDSRWVSEEADIPNWVSIDLGELHWVEAIQFYTRGFYGTQSPLTDFVVQYKDGNGWVDLLQESGNTQDFFARKFPPIQTDGVRLQIDQTTDKFVRIYEIEIFGSRDPLTNLTAGQAPLSPKVYPNPARMVARIEAADLQAVTLYDLQGRALTQTRADVSQLILTDLPDGLYLLRIETRQGTFMHKLVKE